MTNCLFFALKKWFSCGGYLVIRKSKVGWWPHFLWSKDLKTFYHYLPVSYKENKPIPPCVFKGEAAESEARDNL
jgi:hypothetical protein